MIRLNRDDRRILESKLRSDAEENETWFFVTVADHVDFLETTDVLAQAERGVEIGTGCHDDDDRPVDVTIEIGHLGLIKLGQSIAEGSEGAPEPSVHRGAGFAEHAWRWSPKRRGFYAEVTWCDACGDVHIPVLRLDTIKDILRVAQEKGHKPHEPS